MAFILNIDTAVITASVCIAQDDRPLKTVISNVQKDSAAWLHPAIKEIFEETGIGPQQLDAVAVSAGPGSYTGLRVGMAATKGLAYGLQKPMIAISTLQMMAMAATGQAEGLLCPMIDARRAEIFTAIYNQELDEVVPPCNLIVESNPFLSLLDEKLISFFGNGCAKLQPLLQHQNARFAKIEATAEHLCSLSFKAYRQKKFADIAYTEPAYGKKFFTPPEKISR
ncbi:MAG: tRNA (adenosine(37)-N6)-threonylcarbamoyltransferase complex dimerization subunit type 1 TsaB [Bacteroidota bacterium]